MTPHVAVVLLICILIAALVWLILERRSARLSLGAHKRTIDDAPGQDEIDIASGSLRWRGPDAPKAPASATKPVLQQQVHVPAGLLAKLGRNAGASPYPANGASTFRDSAPDFGQPTLPAATHAGLASPAWAQGDTRVAPGGVSSPFVSPARPAAPSAALPPPAGQAAAASLMPQAATTAPGPAVTIATPGGGHTGYQGPMAFGLQRYVPVRLGTPLWAKQQGAAAAAGVQPSAAPGPGPQQPYLQAQPQLASPLRPQQGPPAAAVASPAIVQSPAVLPPAAPPAQTPSRVPVADFELSWQELQIGETIGQGAFGRVFKARWRGSMVAVKTVLAPSSDSLVDDFTAEVAVISALRHPNVLLFMAACVSPQHLALVTELAPQGSLWDLLRRAHAPLPTARVLDIALGIARGMAYLHSARPLPILHRDLKSANILLDAHGGVKVSDFGLARVKAVAWSMTGGIGTFQWMAPEVLANQPYTESADVYSYGVILWEMLTRDVPFANLAASSNQLHVAIQVMTAGLRPGMEGIPGDYPRPLVELMTGCWAQDPAVRPSFLDVVGALENMQHAMAHM